MSGRSYTLKRRAESREATRARIVEALMQLHEELGPKNATISAIAERAGVQRLTVYRHFKNEIELFEACTARWLELHPLPDPSVWSEIESPLKRSQAALNALYRYYRGTERMWSVSLRDENEVAALAGPMQAFRHYLAAVAADLIAGFAPAKSRRKKLGATVNHAVQFSTWVSLAEQGLSDKEAAALAVAWMGAVARVSGHRSQRA